MPGFPGERGHPHHHRDARPAAGHDGRRAGDALGGLGPGGQPAARAGSASGGGIAKIERGAGEMGMTATGSMMGTPFFMSPEQLLSSKHVDSRADLWALGPPAPVHPLPAHDVAGPTLRPAAAGPSRPFVKKSR